jgi:hypothetical protein
VQAIRVRIPGEFWDSQIANGRLFLFGRSGDIRILDWDRLVDGLKVRPSLKAELNWALCRSDALYKAHANLGHPGAETWQLLRRKFDQLADLVFEISPELQDKYSVAHIDNMLPFPHRDSTIHSGQLYVVGQQGLHGVRTSGAHGHKSLGRPTRFWDGNAFALRRKADSLAIPAGDDGLFGLSVNYQLLKLEGTARPFRITHENCVDCGWLYGNIYGSSFKSNGYLVYSADGDRPSLRQNFVRNQMLPHTAKLIPAKDIFQFGGYSWGTQDSICQVEGNTIRIVRYSPRAKHRSKQLKVLGRVQIEGWKGEILSACVAVFGIVIECENALVIKLSSEEVITLPGEIVRFRSFPESARFENQLHVVYDERLDILAFTHDYFLDQRKKLIGYSSAHSSLGVESLE